jgi:hypothetical protein
MPVANEVIFVRHLGYHKDSYTPTLRGFDHFLGYYSGAEEHFTHMKGGIRGDGKMVNFYDLANNTGGTLSRAGSGIAPHVVGNRSWDDGLYSAYLYGNETARYIRQHDPAVRGSAPTLTRALGHRSHHRTRPGTRPGTEGSRIAVTVALAAVLISPFGWCRCRCACANDQPKMS